MELDNFKTGLLVQQFDLIKVFYCLLLHSDHNVCEVWLVCFSCQHYFNILIGPIIKYQYWQTFEENGQRTINYQRLNQFIIVMVNLNYLGIFITILYTVSSQQIYSSLHRYFKNADDEEFYASIGFNEEIASFMAGRWRSWQSLYILKDKQEANNFYLKKGSTSIIFSNVEEQEKSILPLNLGQTCQRYFPEKPKMLIITLQKNIIPLLQSNNWTDGLCLPDLIVIEHLNNSNSIEEYLSKTGYTKQKQYSNIIEFTSKAHTQTQYNSLQTYPYLPTSKILSNAQQLLGKEPFEIHILTEPYLIINNLFNFHQEKQQNVFVLNFHPITDFIALEINQTITYIENKSNSNFYKFQINQNVSSSKYFLFIPFQSSLTLHVMKLQSESFCMNRPQNIIITKSTQQIVTSKYSFNHEVSIVEQIEEPIKDESDFSSLIEYALIIAILLLLIYVIFKLTRTIKKDPIKQKYKNITYSSISKIEDYPQQEIQIQYQ